MTLHLLPNLLFPESTLEQSVPECVKEVVARLDGLIAETPTEGRRYLKKFQTKLPPNQIPITDMREDIDFILEPLEQGEEWGLVSDCGLPCVADPGSRIVTRAYQKKIRVVAYPGPSSIMMSLMLSGLPGQHFTFHGYIAKDPKKRQRELIKWQKEPVTHLFIEAPHRNEHTLKEMLEVLKPDTDVVVAINLMSERQEIRRGKAGKWKEDTQIDKEPAIFLFRGT
jgi:16S rRNA (cytidine1402-2'-O)-methyltransferase